MDSEGMRVGVGWERKDPNCVSEHKRSAKRIQSEDASLCFGIEDDEKKRSCWRKREAREVGEASRGGPRIQVNCHTKTYKYVYIPLVLQKHGVFRNSIDFTPKKNIRTEKNRAVRKSTV